MDRDLKELIDALGLKTCGYCELSKPDVETLTLWYEIVPEETFNCCKSCFSEVRFYIIVAYDEAYKRLREG